MYVKGNKFYADWTDAEGHRRRKSFNTAKAALSYQNEQRNTNPQKAGGKSRPSSRHLRFDAKHVSETATFAAPRKSSSKLQVISGQKNSRGRTDTKSMQPSVKAVTPIRRAGTQRRQSRAYFGGSIATRKHRTLLNKSADTPDSDRAMLLPRKPRRRNC